MLTVYVTIEGGVIQGVDVPAGARVIVRDYDTDGEDPDILCEDDDGNSCLTSVYEHDE